jgi:hypothetical protein
MMKSRTTQPTRLFRYTSLPALLYLLNRRKLTLLSPDKWEDKNDVAFMNAYKERLKYKCVLAICFAQASETFHHWKVFTSGSDGIRIEFDSTRLLRSLKSSPALEFRKVDYRQVRDLQIKKPRPEALPFLKRYPFRDEVEFRIVYSSENKSEKNLRAKDFDIDLASINQITLSPWLSASLRDVVTETISQIGGCDEIPVGQSQLVEFRRWISLAES